MLFCEYYFFTISSQSFVQIRKGENGNFVLEVSFVMIKRKAFIIPLPLCIIVPLPERKPWSFIKEKN